MSAHHHVAATVHVHRTKAHAAISHARATTRRTPLTHAPGDAVVDSVTGQEGVILSGKTVHVHAQSADVASSGKLPGQAG
jgi:hypothetical protein